MSLFKQYHEYRTHTEELENAYRLQVAELLEGDDETYNLAFNTSKRTLSIQILGRDDEPFKLHDEEGYNKYVNNYVDWEHETLGVDKNLIRPSFLKRNIHSHIQHPMYRLSSNMEYKICRNTYHLFYVIGTEDSLVSTKNAEPTNEAQDKNKRFQLWLTNKSN